MRPALQVHANCTHSPARNKCSLRCRCTRRDTGERHAAKRIAKLSLKGRDVTGAPLVTNNVFAMAAVASEASVLHRLQVRTANSLAVRDRQCPSNGRTGCSCEIFDGQVLYAYCVDELSPLRQCCGASVGVMNRSRRDGEWAPAAGGGG